MDSDWRGVALTGSEGRGPEQDRRVGRVVECHIRSGGEAEADEHGEAEHGEVPKLIKA